MRLQDTKKSERNLIRLYWLMRFGIAIIWVWTAIVSWFIYPHAESIDWLHRLGLTYETHLLFAAACFFDLAMGIAATMFASKRLWVCQILVVTFYSLAIGFGLPEFLIHPFGPLVKNIAVLGCLSYLMMMEDR